MDFKAKDLSKKAIEHLIDVLGYETDKTKEQLFDYPYHLIYNGKIVERSSKNSFNMTSLDYKKESEILKMRPKNEKEDFKSKPKKERLLHELMRKLNHKKNSNLPGYNVSWGIKKEDILLDEYSIFPITNTACGSITQEHIELALDFAKQHGLKLFLSYTNYNREKGTYGTFTPCLSFY